jgi:hypothetical protein
MRPDGNYDSWYIRSAVSGQYLLGYRNWDNVEGAFVRDLLQSALLWLGVLELGYAVSEVSAECFRVTDEGAAIARLDRGVTDDGADVGPQEKATGPYVVHKSFHIDAALEASWYDRFLLERFARWVEEGPSQARYVLDAASVRRALQSEVSAEQITGFLRRVTGGKVPERVLQALDMWGRER